jgi:hypothetical protein
MERIARPTSFNFLLALALLLVTSHSLRAQVRVVNMIPNSRSGETSQDSEPNLAVNPINRLQIVGSAFTPDPMGGPNAPIYVSTNGGNTWALNSILPGNSSLTGTGDITVRFGGTSNILYAGTLRGGSGLTLNILRTANFTAPTVMDLLVTRASVDQPYIQAATVLGGGGTGNDRVYAGNNDFGAASGKTASIDQHLNVATVVPAPPSGFTTGRIDVRTTSGQDGPPIRPAIHLNGTVYGIFYHWTTFTGSAATADVVVVRDDSWGTSASPFTALTDTPGDGLSGRRVVTGITVPWANTNQASFGQERFVGSNITIAVDPTNSARIFIAWADRVGASDYTLHVRSSSNGGSTWTADLLTITNATNPALAINTHGQAGFLYQQLTGSGASQRWETHLRRSSTGTVWNDLVLARPLANTPTALFGPYTGDYVHLMAVGKDYYGIFSANNTPDLANFPNGVTYQRNANFSTHSVLDLSNNPIGNSIDPFFFNVTEVAAENDFYVRDWTNSPTSGDPGLEPSTNPVFYATSDVWNRRGTLSGEPFATDQPDNENAGNGIGNIGDNWAFTRIRRNALPTSGSTVVTAHFLVSPFGTGSNFIAGTTAPVSFMGSDPTVTFTATDLGPITTVGQQWHLDAVASTHLCMAVEISTAGDPFVAPSLLGTAPGWPTTDLRVINDNNKAQRNLGLSTTPARGVGGLVTYYALIHNAATFPRDMVLLYEASGEVAKRLRGASVAVVGFEDGKTFQSGDSIVLTKMQPGENRWLAFTYKAPEGKDGEILPVNFYEMVGNVPVNGFTIAARPSNMTRVISDNLELHRSVFTRLAAGFRTPGAGEEAEAAQKLGQDREVKDDEYMSYLKSHIEAMEKSLGYGLINIQQKDMFGTAEALKGLRSAVQSGKPETAALAHTALLNRIDSAVTMQQMSQGNPADVLQNVRWQKDLFKKLPKLANMRCSSSIIDLSERFISAYGMRKANNEDYPALVERSFGCLRDGLKLLDRGNLIVSSEEVERNRTNPAAIQKLHRELLLRLQAYGD